MGSSGGLLIILLLILAWAGIAKKTKAGAKKNRWPDRRPASKCYFCTTCSKMLASEDEYVKESLANGIDVYYCKACYQKLTEARARKQAAPAPAKKPVAQQAVKPVARQAVKPDAEKLARERAAAQSGPLIEADFLSRTPKDFAAFPREALYPLFNLGRSLDPEYEITCVDVDLRNGRFVREDARQRSYGVFSGGENTYGIIGLEEVKRLAQMLPPDKSAAFAGLREENWRDFVPEEKLRAFESPVVPPRKRVPAGACAPEPDIDAFYLRLELRFASSVCYVRRTGDCWRALYVTTDDMTHHFINLKPEACAEAHILALLTGEAHAMGCHKLYDRRLNGFEAGYVFSLMPADLPDRRPEGVAERRVPISIYGARLAACYRKRGGWVNCADMEGLDKLGDAIRDAAEYGLEPDG